MINRLVFSLVLLLLSTNLYATINLANVTGWSTVLQGPTLDPGNDQQAVNSIDLLGDATYPMFYMEFDDLGDTVPDPSNDEVAFSFRGDNVVDNSGVFVGYLWIGLDFDDDGKIDVFMVLNGDNKNVQTLTVYDSDPSKLNDRPSETSLLSGKQSTETAVIDGFFFQHYLAPDIADIDGVDANGDGVLDGDGDPDYIVSYKVAMQGVNGLAAALNKQFLSTDPLKTLSTLDGGNGVGLNTPFKIVVSSAQNVNALNGDLGGYSGGDDTVTYIDKGAFTPTITFSDTDPLDLAQTTLTVSSSSVDADGVTTSTITVQAKDSVGADLTTSPGTLTLFVTGGNAVLGSITDVNGTYTATIKNATAEIVTISGKIDGNDITATADITFNDITKPVITLSGSASLNIILNSSYSDAGATAVDETDDIITGSIITVNPVDTSTVGVYTVTYNVDDAAGNSADQVSRTVTVFADVTKPVITLSGAAVVNVEVGGSYSDAGAAASDDIDGDITGDIVTSNPVNTSIVGGYTVTYNVSDNAGNTAVQVTRTVNVTTDATPPVITLIGADPVNLELGAAYNELGASATDNIDNSIVLGAFIVIDASAVEINVIGTYTVTYNVDDAVGNSAAEVTRTVNVTADVTKPVISLTGANPQLIELGNSYTELGATATDNVDSAASITGDIVIDATAVDVNTLGSYNVTYDVTDTATNVATTVTRVVTITADVTKPVISLTGANPQLIELGSSYTELGATATDNVDDDAALTLLISVGGVVSINTAVPGDYNVTYDVSDTGGNAAVTVTRVVRVFDNTIPSVDIQGEPPVVSSFAPFNVTIEFSEDVTGFISTDVNVGNGSVTGFVAVDDNTYTIQITPDGAGNITIDVAANVAQDVSGNDNTAATTATIVFDNTPPDVEITSSPTINLANQATYTIEGICTAGDGNVTAVLTFDSLTIAPSVSCTAGGAWSATFNLSPKPAGLGVPDGNNVVSFSAVQVDSVGNSDSATPVPVDKDTVEPGVVISGAPVATNASSFDITITFSEGVTGFVASDIVVVNGAAGSLTGGPVSYSATITTSGGDVALDISAGVASDAADNPNTAATTVNVVFDTTAPIVSINPVSTVNVANVASYDVAGNCTAGDGDVSVTIAGVTPATQSVPCTAGSWNATFDVTAIADGSNAITVQASQTDIATNIGNAANVQADKDVAITIPTVNALATNNARPVISGTADTDSSNKIEIAGATYTVVATAGNLWSLDTDVVSPVTGTFNLIDGFNDVLVTSTDAAGNSATDNMNNEILLSLDDDNDGIPNAVECPGFPVNCPDTDDDTIPDYLDTDSDGDGIDDAVEAGLDSSNPIDTDGDGTPDYRDTDSDNDLIDDAIEGSSDTDGDGIPDYVDVGSTGDSDGDGIPDIVECPAYPACPNSDGIGSPDYLDTDSDNDGIDDAVEAGVDPTMPIDTDGDGTPDYQDTDSDQDGDTDSAEGVTDADGDGIPDYVDVITTGPGAGDSDGDGIADNIECVMYPFCADSDADGMPDYMETDSDDDGISDIDETGSALNDADSDGIDDTFDIDITAGLSNGLDQNGDGIDDTQPLDTDGDGLPDYQDTDSDGDGIDDIVECPVGTSCPDADSDGIPDHLDASIGDASGSDISGSGDSDGDGISDALECVTGVPCPDVDQDGLPDYMDNNPDDGPAANFDNDALPNYLDPDDDNDNIPDVVEDPNLDGDNDPASNPLDSDLDGIPDYLDSDSDNDGLSDAVESGASGNDSDGDNIDDSYDVDQTGGTDSNGDGIDDDVRPLDSDGDSLPDYLDTVFDGSRDTVDSDGDGISDATECPVFPTDCPDSDGDGIPDFLETDSDGDGLDDRDETGSLDSGVLLDTDGDGTPDYRDLDSDGDGIPDATEGLLADSDNDGIPDALDADSSGAPFGGDSDGDDVVDMDECISYPNCTDSNGDGTPDYMDASIAPYDPDAKVSTALNGVGSYDPWSLLFIATAFMLRRKIIINNKKKINNNKR